MANEIIGVITNVEDDKDFNKKDYKKVTLGTGQVLKVKQGREGALKDKWGLLQTGVAIKFTMKDFTTGENVKIPFVFDIETVEGELPPPQDKGKLLAEDQRIIDKALQKEPAPQAVGMITKEIGDHIRAGTLVDIFGAKIAGGLVEWYRGQTLGITRITYNGKDLPQIGGKDVKAPKEVSDENIELVAKRTVGDDDSGRDELIIQITERAKELGQSGTKVLGEIGKVFQIDSSKVTRVKDALEQLTTAQLKLFLKGLKED